MTTTDHPRAIAHLDLDTFFVSVERLTNRALEGRPVIVGGAEGRGVVASCSYEARRFGVRAGMPGGMAKRLCPEAVFVRGDFERYAHYSKLIAEVVSDSAPLAEQASIDEFYLDLTGMEHYVGVAGWTDRLRARLIAETGLPMSMGIGANKYVAKVATGQAKPNGKLMVADTEVEAFLAPLPVSKIPGVGPVIRDKLAQLGVRDIKGLRGIPIEALQARFGRTGTMLWQRARGHDEALVIPTRAEKSLSTECTFQTDSMDVVALRATLQHLTEGLSFALRKNNRLTSCITVKIRYSDFSTFTKQKTIPYTSDTRSLCKWVQELFEALYERRVMLRLVGVCFSSLCYGGRQAHLFTDTGELLALDKAIDRMRAKHGPRAVTYGSSFGALSYHMGHTVDVVPPRSHATKQRGSGRDITDFIPGVEHYEDTPDGF